MKTRSARKWMSNGLAERLHIREILKSARSRCENPNVPNYKNYGGRGITFCADWVGVEGALRFSAEIGPRPSKLHTLDRIDNDRGYEPGNVRWATRAEQNRNRRPSRKKVPQTVMESAREAQSINRAFTGATE